MKKRIFLLVILFSAFVANNAIAAKRPKANNDSIAQAFFLQLPTDQLEQKDLHLVRHHAHYSNASVENDHPEGFGTLRLKDGFVFINAPYYKEDDSQQIAGMNGKGFSDQFGAKKAHTLSYNLNITQLTKASEHNGMVTLIYRLEDGYKLQIDYTTRNCKIRLSHMGWNNEWFFDFQVE